MLSGFDCLIRKAVENGQTIFPEAFVLTDKERIDRIHANPRDKVESIERLKKINGAKYYSQYSNDPLDEENLEFKRDWFQRFEYVPEVVNKLATVPVIISIDPAFRLNQTNDDTGICVTKTTPDNMVYILEASGKKLNGQMLVEEIFRLVKQYQFVSKVLIETVTSQILLLPLLQDQMKQRNIFFTIEEVKPTANEIKHVRIRSLIPHYANRRIFHAPHLVQLEEQLIEFPKGAHDDIIDALSYQLRYWHPTSETPPIQGIPEGSYEWWRKRVDKPHRLGNLFKDFERR